jgi:hypothetical protein
MTISEFVEAVTAQQTLEATAASAKADVDAVNVLVTADLVAQFSAYVVARDAYSAARDVAWAARNWHALNDVKNVADAAVLAGKATLAAALASYSEG